MLKLHIDNRDLAYTIDSYQTFTMDSDYEYIAAGIIDDSQARDAGRLDDMNDADVPGGIDYNNLDSFYEFNYDHSGYIKHLAECSIEVLEGEFIRRYEYGLPDADGVRSRVLDDIVHGIELDKTASPSFYNYTTDSYIATWTINDAALIKYIDARRAAYDAFMINEYDAYDRMNKLDKNAPEFDADYLTISMLDYYTRTEFTVDQYTDGMYDKTSAYQFIEYKKIKGNKTNE